VSGRALSEPPLRGPSGPALKSGPGSEPERTESGSSPAQWVGRLIESRAETPTVRTFFFEPPTVPFSFRPGQYLALRIPGVSDPRGDSRTLSMSSAPSDLDAVTITTREGTSPFKRELFRMTPGSVVEIWGPFGSFTPDPTRPAVLLCGGVGITPFRSVIREAANRRSTVPLTLLYSSRSVEEIVYRNELEELAQRWDKLRLAMSVTRPAGHSNWSGLTGRIDRAKVRRYADDFREPRYYVSGPPAMVRELEGVLTGEVGVPPNEIETELFAGY
jgi:ferredoxin-NADP reductase